MMNEIRYARIDEIDEELKREDLTVEERKALEAEKIRLEAMCMRYGGSWT